MVKKIDVGGPCGLSAGFVGALLSPAGVLSAAALLSCRKTGKGILPYGKYLKTVFFSEPFFPLSCVVAQLHVHSCSCRGSHLFSMAPLCRQCPCGLFAYGCRCPDDREDNTYGLCAHVRRTADHQPRPLFAQPVCPRQRDYPHEGGQIRSAWREIHPYRVWRRPRNHCAAGQ